MKLYVANFTSGSSCTLFLHDEKGDEAAATLLSSHARSAEQHELGQPESCCRLASFAPKHAAASRALRTPVHGREGPTRLAAVSVCGWEVQTRGEAQLGGER